MQSNKKHYKQIYFDLDRTLWDYDANTEETLKELLAKHNLTTLIKDETIFVQTYHKINEYFWNLYRKGKMTKQVLRTKRFIHALEEFGIHDESLAEKIGEEFITLSPFKNRVVPHTFEILSYLSVKYDLYILTNGFNEVQFIKLRESGLEGYFKKVFTSENCGAQKPNPGIFAYALSSVNAKKHESIMVGDDLEADIVGAKMFGIDQVYFNPRKNPHAMDITHEISSLNEIRSIL